MIARLRILLPQPITIPEGEKFSIYSYVDDNCEVRIYPPNKSDIPTQTDDLKDIEINGAPAFRANSLRIDFVRENFDLRESIECDPSYEFIQRTVNSFLTRLRFVTRGIQIKLLDFPQCTWFIDYLNDDETEVQKQEGMVLGRGRRTLNFSWTVVNSRVWDDIHHLSPLSTTPVWDTLSLDAMNLLPEVGPAIVLAATALEVFIAQILNQLAEQSSIPQELWTWINERDWLKEPSVEEQFDALLYILTGTSLKTNQRLWEGFIHLKGARNNFVHEGVAKINKRAVALTHEDARRLVNTAIEIIRFVKDQLPENMKWPEYQNKLNVRVTMKPFGN